ncbi:MAG: DUF2089 domain-containing protein [Thermotogae bacterium]|nr:DUF2089 domain-containing protein [Thermotogota bacterium]
MKNKSLTSCPVCSSELMITEYTCPKCGLIIKGKFKLDEFFKLSQDQLYFVKIFLKHRGNLSEVQKELGISYPTARNRLEDIAQTLGYGQISTQKSQTREILDKLEKGEIDAKIALKLLKEAGGD